MRNRTYLRLRLVHLVLRVPVVALGIKEEMGGAVGLMESFRSLCTVWDMLTLKKITYCLSEIQI